MACSLAKQLGYRSYSADFINYPSFCVNKSHVLTFLLQRLLVSITAYSMNIVCSSNRRDPLYHEYTKTVTKYVETVITKYVTASRMFTEIHICRGC